VVTPAAGGNGPAVAALVLGVLAVSLALNVLLFLLAVPVGIAAVVLGVTGARRARITGMGRGQALAGGITGGIASLLGVAWIVLGVNLLGSFPEVAALLGRQPAAVDAEATTGVFAGACERSADRRAVGGEYRAGDHTVTGVVVCSDSSGDFAFSATVRNDGGSTAPVTLELQALADGQIVGTADSIVTVPPGHSVDASFTGVDDYRADWSQIAVTAS
jgi:hypothetical protein